MSSSWRPTALFCWVSSGTCLTTPCPSSENYHKKRQKRHTSVGQGKNLNRTNEMKHIVEGLFVWGQKNNSLQTSPSNYSKGPWGGGVVKLPSWFMVVRSWAAGVRGSVHSSTVKPPQHKPKKKKKKTKSNVADERIYEKTTNVICVFPDKSRSQPKSYEMSAFIYYLLFIFVRGHL